MDRFLWLGAYDCYRDLNKNEQWKNRYPLQGTIGMGDLSRPAGKGVEYFFKGFVILEGAEGTLRACYCGGICFKKGLRAATVFEAKKRKANLWGKDADEGHEIYGGNIKESRMVWRGYWLRKFKRSEKEKLRTEKKKNWEPLTDGKLCVFKWAEGEFGFTLVMAVLKGTCLII
ncbi:hypothetical protein Tco_0543580 [Tanacetum coccineum]